MGELEIKKKEMKRKRKKRRKKWRNTRGNEVKKCVMVGEVFTGRTRKMRKGLWEEKISWCGKRGRERVKKRERKIDLVVGKKEGKSRRASHE